MKQIDLLNPKDLFRAQYNNHVTRNATGQLTGVNLCGAGMNDEQINKKLSEDLSQLKVLNLSENRLESFTVPAECEQLEYFDISENPGLKTVIFKGGYKNLKVLDANECAIESLDLPVGFDTLHTVDLRKNSLSKVEIKGDANNLVSLDLSGNQLEELILSSGFQNLQYLYLNDNQLKRLEFSSSLAGLKTLHLRKNQLENLPENFLGSELLETLYVHGNPMSAFPPAILPENERDNSYEKIRDYLIEAGKGTVLNDRVKIIFVGNGRVGKTSMYKRIAGQAFDSKEPFTHGVQLGSLSKVNLPEVKTGDLQANVWDFGGQEIFYATHQFFLSEDALYIFAWTDEQNVAAHRERDKDQLPFDEKWRSREYWLENIRLHGKNSPILMVQTHTDQLRAPLNEQEYEPYQVECLNFSAAKDFGLHQLKDQIVQKINTAIPFFGEAFPATYDQVIDAVAVKKQETPFISLVEFHQICNEHRISAGGEDSVLDYLIKTGVVVHFDTPKLKKVVYIDPDWLTGQVYQLINNRLRERKGRIDQAYLNEMFPGYTDIQLQQFTELLQKFELIFKENEEEEIYISPQYLPSKLTGDAAELFEIVLEDLEDLLVCRFPKFFPENVMINFLSRYGPYARKLYWKSGICFTTDYKAKCIVTYDEENRSLSIHTRTDEKGKLLQREVHQALIELSKDAYVELSLDGQAYVPWNELVAAYNRGMSEIFDITRTGSVQVSDFDLLLRQDQMRGSIVPGFLEGENRPSYSGDYIASPENDVYFDGIKKILFLAANPSGQSQIKTNPEHRKIKEELQQGAFRDQYEFLPSEFALTAKSLLRAFSKNKPDIIHFAGHGEQDGIIIAKENNEVQRVSTDALKFIFRPLTGIVKIIILNACYSAKQAQELSEIGVFVVGNKLPVNDDAAITFSVGFYLGLGEGKGFFGALNDGIALLMIEHGNDQNVIEVWKDGKKLEI